ncbi:hypothetical protein BUE80_DR013393 [Diplocarpon rosae]|nr:hypothetical protein BUE80_DR013393 [Diplocarpon rosae]
MEFRSTSSTAKDSINHRELLRGRDVTTKTIKTPQFSYAHLQLISEVASLDPPLDVLTTRSYIESALTQFLGLTGSAILVDILKVKGGDCWIRVPHEDVRPVLAALGGWSGGSEADGKVGWKVKTSGNWLSVLVAHGEASHIWDELKHEIGHERIPLFFGKRPID